MSSSSDLVRDSVALEAPRAGSNDGDDSAGRAAPLHPHLESPVGAQLEVVHHVRYEEEAAAPGRHEIGHGLRVEGLDVEPSAAVCYRDDQIGVLEAQRDQHVLLGAAVTNGVRAGLFDAEDDLVGEPGVVAVSAQVVADALPGAQEVRGLRGQPEREAGQLRLPAVDCLGQGALTPRCYALS